MNMDKNDKWVEILFILIYSRTRIKKKKKKNLKGWKEFPNASQDPCRGMSEIMYTILHVW